MPTKLLNKLFWNGDSKAYPILVNIFYDVKVSEPLADEAQFFDTFSGIFDNNFYLVREFNFDKNTDEPVKGIFDCIVHNVN